MDKPFKDQTDIAAFNTQSTLEDLLTIKEFFHIFFSALNFHVLMLIIRINNSKWDYSLKIAMTKQTLQGHGDDSIKQIAAKCRAAIRETGK